MIPGLSKEDIVLLSDRLAQKRISYGFRNLYDFQNFTKEYSFLNRFLDLPFSEIPLNFNTTGYDGYRDWVKTILLWRLEIGK